MRLTFHRASLRVQQFFQAVRSFPLRTTLQTLQKRFDEDQLGLTASSLTFTTLLALVPFFTVLLSVFTAFPSFGRLQESLQHWFVQSLIPVEIAEQVIGYLVQFSSKASQLGIVGLAFLLVTVISLILTMDRTLNHIWRVQRMRPFGQRLLIYWGVITFGPLLLGMSIATTSYVVSASRGLVEVLPQSVQVAFNSLEFFLLAGAMTALYHFVPNTTVKWRYAWVGGLLVATGLAIAKKLLGVYLSTVPTYSVIYGTFATLPILLIWIYTCWLIFLLGAVVAAYLPSLLAGTSRDLRHPGWAVGLALEIVATLDPLRMQSQRGESAHTLAKRLRVDSLQLEPALNALTALRWVGAMPESGVAYLQEGEPRYVLLADPDQTLLAPLIEHMLVSQAQETQPLWERADWRQTKLRDVLPQVAILETHTPKSLA